MVVTLTSKGLITIPASVRKQLSLHTGDRLSFVVTDNRVEMIPISQSVKSLKTILPKPTKRLTLAGMAAAIVKGALS